MRGSPLLRASIAFALLLAFSLPVWRLTRAKSPRQSIATSREEVAAAVSLSMEFTRVPRTINVFHLGKQIAALAPRSLEIRERLQIAWPPEGIDLRFQIDWPEESPIAAARIRLTAPDGTEHERSVWSKGLADEIVTFP